MFTQRYLNSELSRVRKMLLFDIMLLLINLIALVACCYGIEQHRYISAGLFMALALYSTKLNLISFRSTFRTYRTIRFEQSRLEEPEPRVHAPRINVPFYGEKSN